MQGVTMSQISPPIRILLVGCVLFLAAWMTVLKPKGEAPAPAPAAAPATPRVAAGGEKAGTSLGKAVEAANNASKAQVAANARHGDESQQAPSSTGAAAKAPSSKAAAGTAGTPSTGAATKVADVAGTGLPISVAKAVAARKVLVLLFWNPKAADDRAVRREMRSVGSRHRKDVVVHIANVKDIARYAPVTRGANVEQSPSVVVVNRNRQATLLEGYSDRETIRQAVYDALRTK
jgi:hypothetical protein